MIMSLFPLEVVLSFFSLIIHSFVFIYLLTIIFFGRRVYDSFTSHARACVFRNLTLTPPELCAIHLTGDDDDLLDPTCDRFYKNIWLYHAAQNTKIFERVFNCFPSDKAFTFRQVMSLDVIIR